MPISSEPLFTPESAGSDLAVVSNARRWSVVGLLYTASLINYLDRATVSFALPYISSELHLATHSTQGVLLSAFFVSYAAMQIPMGIMSDRLNLRWVYAGAFAFWSLAQGLTGLAGSLGVLIAFRILLGMGEAIYLPGGTKIVSRLFPAKERGLPSGLFDFGTRSGLALEGLLIPWLLIRYGWRQTFMFVGFLALLWLIPWFAAFPSDLRKNNGPRAVPESKSTTRPWTVHLDRNLVGICLGFFCFDYFWYLLLTWLPNYFYEARHLSIMKTGLYAAVPFFVFGVSEPIGGWIGDRLIRRGWDETRTRKGLVTVAFLFGLFLIPAARVQTAWAAFGLILGACLVGLATGNLLVILQCCARPEEVGVWTGFENTAGNVAGILAPIITGFLIDRTGSYYPGFVLAAVVLVSGILAYWLVVGELKPLRDFSRMSLS